MKETPIRFSSVEDTLLTWHPRNQFTAFLLMIEIDSEHEMPPLLTGSPG